MENNPKSFIFLVVANYGYRYEGDNTDIIAAYTTQAQAIEHAELANQWYQSMNKQSKYEHIAKEENSFHPGWKFEGYGDFADFDVEEVELQTHLPLDMIQPAMEFMEGKNNEKS